MRRALGVALLLAAGCSSRPGKAGLDVVVKFGPRSQAKCVIVRGTASGITRSTEAMPRGAKTELKVGVNATADFQGDVTLVAVGFSSDTCDAATQSELSAEVAAKLDATVPDVTLTLDGPPATDGGTDADGDGYLAAVDCNDADPAVHPGAAERCDNAPVDDDCDGLLDCAEVSCGGQGCNDLDLCTTGETCSGGACAGGTVMGCTTPGFCETQDGGRCQAGACVYPAAVGQPCTTGGACNSMRMCTMGEVLCGDGLDNDNDAGADCADPACASLACDAGTLLCFTEATCQASVCRANPAQPRDCSVPAGGCLTAMGCSDDAGCTYSVNAAGSTCAQGSCRTDGGCGPPETAALCADGLDNDSDNLTDCADPSCAGGACTSTDQCLMGTTCTGLQCGGGAAVMCGTRVCQISMGCDRDAGCVYGNEAPGTPCGDGGACQAGSCGPMLPPTLDGGFQYKPSNISLTAVPFSGAVVELNGSCTSAWINTDLGGTRFNAWCAGTQPTATLMNQDGGGEQVWVFSMSALNISDAGQLRVAGSQAAVFVVYGDAVIGGRLVAEATLATNRPAGASGGTTNGATSGTLVQLAHCGAGTAGDGVSDGANQTGTGAGGGGFGSRGGRGGRGANSSAAVGAGGQVNGNAELLPLRGGCGGGRTGGSSVAGVGGGALQLSVAGTLTVRGRIGAPGEEGNGGNDSDGNGSNAGGQGAGSGGAVLLEAGQLVLAPGSLLTAHGGGAGAGDDDPEALPGGGQSGERGHTEDTVPAHGRATNGRGGRGGDGATGTVGAMDGGDGTAGSSRQGAGGGGGGGVGRIRLRSLLQCTSAGAVVSPAPGLSDCP